MTIDPSDLERKRKYPCTNPNCCPPVTNPRNLVGYGVVVGRFQCDELTEGHTRLLQQVLDLHAGRLLVVVGCLRGPHNATNPLPYAIREVMIRQHFPSAIIVPLKDCRENEEWSRELDAVIQTVTGEFSAARLYSGRDGFLPWYTGAYETELLESGIECCATDIRKQIAANPNASNRWFRQGVIYAHHTRVHQDYQTVDIAVLRRNPYEPGKGVAQVLLGRKPNETLWRFPGGFVEPGELVLQAGPREQDEETRTACKNGSYTILDEFIIDDWRVRRQKNVGHKGWLIAGEWDGISEAQAGDDLAEVQWFGVEYVSDNAESLLMVEHRRAMFSRLVSYCYEAGFLQPKASNA